MPSSVSHTNLFRSFERQDQLDLKKGSFNHELPRSERCNKNRPIETKALVLDLDGTLLTDNGTIPKDASAVLNAIESTGRQVILASGRPPSSVFSIRSQLGIKGGFISLNGAYIENSAGIKQTFPMQSVHVDRIVSLAKANGVVANLHTESLWLTTDPTNKLTKKESASLGYKPDGMADRNSLDMLSVTGDKVLKISILGNLNELSLIRAELQRSFVVSYLSNDTSLDVTGYCSKNSCVSSPIEKRFGVSQLLESEGMSLRDALVLGDGENDSTLLASAGYGISFPNANSSAVFCSDEEIFRDPIDTIIPYLRNLYFPQD